MSAIARNIIFPHLAELHNHTFRVVYASCDKCNTVQIIPYNETFFELDSVAAAQSFIDRHKHDEWPEVIS